MAIARLIKPDRRALAATLRRDGFDMEDIDGDLTFARASLKPGLFERVEITLVGRESDVMVVAMALAIVRYAKAQRRGFVVRRNLPELCDDPDSAKVRLYSMEAWWAWLARLESTAPGRVRELAEEAGDKLLETTRAARERAESLFQRFVLRTVDEVTFPRSLEASLSDRQRARVDRLIKKPFMSRVGLETECRAAVMALVLDEDPEALRTADQDAIPLDMMARLREVPESVTAVLCLIVDLILRHRANEVST